MAEIALRTSERRCQKKKYLALRPKGAAIICQSDSTIRRKWLEICCDLMSPQKRHQFPNVPGWRRLTEAWSQGIHDIWLAADRATETYPLGRLLGDLSYAQIVWDTIVKPLGIDKDLPLAPESDKPVCDTCLWSAYERRNYFIVVNTNADDAEVDSWQGNEERHDDKGSLVIISRKVVAYETDIGLTPDTLTKIAEPDTVVNPRFDKPVSMAKFIQPTIAAMLEEI